jgi:hypothetical protein
MGMLTMPECACSTLGSALDRLTHEWVLGGIAPHVDPDMTLGEVHAVEQA